MAKWGSPRVLESELKAESRHIRTIIKARGLWYPNVNGKTFAVFRTDKQNHLVSLVRISHCENFLSFLCITRILREIYFWDARSTKSVILIQLEVLNFGLL